MSRWTPPAGEPDTELPLAREAPASARARRDAVT